MAIRVIAAASVPRITLVAALLLITSEPDTLIVIVLAVALYELSRIVITLPIHDATSGSSIVFAVVKVSTGNTVTPLGTGIDISLDKRIRII
jgi:hypothetical protein